MFSCGYKINGKCDIETVRKDFLSHSENDVCIGETECGIYEEWLDNEIKKNHVFTSIEEIEEFNKNQEKLKDAVVENERLKAESMRKKGNEIEEKYIKEKEEAYTNLKPSHYNAGKYDLIWFCQYHKIEFDIGNIMKYVFRAGKKDKSKEIEDLYKAIEYIERRIEFLRGE